MRANGTFQVKLTRATGEENTDYLVAGRQLIDKTFEGDLVGTSVGTMLAVATNMGSAGYVAIERVDATIGGDKSGTFVLQHFGIMSRGTGELIVRVVPDSGTDALTGISGTMTIEIVKGVHRYEFEYSFAS